MLIAENAKALRMRLNLLAWQREVGCPELIIERAEDDRCLCRHSNAFCDWAKQNMDPWTININSPDHRPYGFPTARWGWRERRQRWAIQVIYHYNVINSSSLLEFDFDANNPNWGLLPALMHGIGDYLIQKIRKTKTDPFKVAKKRGWLK